MVAKNQSPAGKLRKDTKIAKNRNIMFKIWKTLKISKCLRKQALHEESSFFYDLQTWLLLTKTTSKTKDVLSEKLSK